MTDKNIQASQKQAFLEQLKKTPFVKAACERSGVSRTSVYRWQEEDEEFAKAVELATFEGKLNTNDATEMQLLSLIYQKNPGSIKYWLEHNHPGYMKKDQGEDKDPGPSVIILHDHED